MSPLRAAIILSLVLNLFYCTNFVSCEETILEPTDRDMNKASRDPVTVDVNVSPALSENEMYKDMLHFTTDNFTDIVMKSKDPWVIIFHDGSFYKIWKTMAATMRGILWIGLVNKNEELGILEYLKIDRANIPTALVIPYNYFGNAKSRCEKSVRVSTPLEARKRAIATLPDNTIKLDKDSFQDYLIESYVASPAKFPTIFLTYERETPALLKALCVRFGEYFHFGIMYDPGVEELRVLGLEHTFLDFPVLMVLVATANSAQDEPELSAVFFDTSKMGDLHYANIVQYLFQINEQYRITIPGNNMANDERVATMSDILHIEKLRFKIVGVDGIEEKKEKEKEEEEEKEEEMKVVEEEEEGKEKKEEKDEL